MSRSLFDPEKAVGAEPPPAPNVDSPLTVSQASDLIKTTLETRLPSPLKVVGQVSNLRANNHWYFSLKDDRSVLNCVAWATSVRRFGFTPRDGDEVVATGHVSHFAPQGRTQMYIDALQPVGAGALELKFRALCDQLRALGYFAEERKRPLPAFPRRIAVITSRTGAALTDVIATASQRCKAIGLLIVDVRVQGDGAAEDVTRAIKWVDAKHQRLGVDAILVTRGGGSIEDLWAFNERMVADAVFKCSLPVVAAIGHESDTTIIELVADVRASTPTQAIVRLIPSSVELCRQIDHLTHRLGSLLQRAAQHERQRNRRGRADLERIVRSRVVHERARLEQLTAWLASLRPTAQLSQRQTRLAVARDRLQRAMAIRFQVRPRLTQLVLDLHGHAARHVRNLREGLHSRTQKLAAMDPHGVLRRGYSITHKPDGTIIKSVGAIHSMERIITRLSDGSFESTVNDGVKPARERQRVPTADSKGQADQLDLFRLGQ